MVIMVTPLMLPICIKNIEFCKMCFLMKLSLHGTCHHIGSASGFLSGDGTSTASRWTGLGVRVGHGTAARRQEINLPQAE